MVRLRLPVRVGWSELFLPGHSCVAIQLQLCLVSSSPSKVGAIQFWMLPSVPEISYGIHHLHSFGMLPVSHPALSLCVFPDLCWVLAAPLGGWLVTPLLLSAFMPLLISAACGKLLGEVGLLPCSRISSLRVWCWGFGSLLHPHSPRQVSSSTPTSTVSVRFYNLLFMFFSFTGWWFSLPRGCVGLFSWGGGGAWCSSVLL
jgi:hypothetical protein